MAPFELPSMPEPRVSPQLMLGVASPLWGYFGAVAAGGVAYWWMTRWTQVANLEAYFGRQALAAPVAALEAMAEPMVEMVEASEEMLETAVEALEGPLPDMPVGGESAPFSPFAARLTEPQAGPEPALEAAPETAPEPLVAEVAPLDAAEPTPEPAVEAAPAIEASPESALEATPEPAPEMTADPLPAPKPRVRKAPPSANGVDA